MNFVVGRKLGRNFGNGGTVTISPMKSGDVWQSVSVTVDIPPENAL
ncbi:hypothetical protein AGMMS49921_14100 [Endomicrobiia bacterium]|nr:hypothetical protein AGMMS49921_14100 [Endomicrobiia bacterium]